MCQVLGVSTSGYYAWRRRPQSRRAKVDQVPRRRIKAIHALLQREGLHCSRKRVIRLMRQAHVCGKCPRCFKRTTQRAPAHGAAPNRLAQHLVATQPNQIGLSEVTYIPTAEGWLYLDAVMDLYSRRILGWAMNASMTDALTQRALTMALKRRQVKPQQLLHHSDRGSQYIRDRYQKLLSRHQTQVSISGTDNCYDNAPMESFFSLLKTELVHHECYATRQAASTSLFDYIEVFYNRQRIHSALDYLSPLDYKTRWLHCFSHKENGMALLAPNQPAMP